MNNVNELYTDILERLNHCVDPSDVPVVMELAKDLYDAGEFTDLEYDSLQKYGWLAFVDLLQDDEEDYDLTIDDFVSSESCTEDDGIIDDFGTDEIIF